MRSVRVINHVFTSQSWASFRFTPHLNLSSISPSRPRTFHSSKIQFQIRFCDTVQQFYKINNFDVQAISQYIEDWILNWFFYSQHFGKWDLSHIFYSSQMRLCKRTECYKLRNAIEYFWKSDVLPSLTSKFISWILKPQFKVHLTI